jgi:hypothetical protein
VFPRSKKGSVTGRLRWPAQATSLCGRDGTRTPRHVAISDSRGGDPNSRIDNHITAIYVLSDRTKRTLVSHSSSCSAAAIDRCAIRGKKGSVTGRLRWPTRATSFFGLDGTRTPHHVAISDSRGGDPNSRIDNHTTAIYVLSDRTQCTLVIHSSSCSAATANRCAIRGTRACGGSGVCARVVTSPCCCLTGAAVDHTMSPQRQGDRVLKNYNTVAGVHATPLGVAGACVDLPLGSPCRVCVALALPPFLRPSWAPLPTGRNELLLRGGYAW